ncbi:MAG TPA: TPM domain-containing protein, partial [Blastocatellia bacterium]
MVLSLVRSLVAVAILAFLTAVSVAQPKQFPTPVGMVNDFAGKLSPETKQGLENLLNNFRARSGVEVVVVTINYADMQDYPIEDYTLYLGRQWGVGRDSEKRALLLLVAIQPPDAQGQYHGGTRLEVSRHLEGEIPDGLAGEIIRKMRDDFRAARFDQALLTGTQTILATLAAKLGISMEGIDTRQAYKTPAQRPRRGGRGISPFMIIILIFIFLSIIRGFGGG